MQSIERRAELCQEPAGLQPCPNCGSTAAIVEIGRGRAPSVRRICCDAVGWWHSPAAAEWFRSMGVDPTRLAGARRG